MERVGWILVKGQQKKKGKKERGETGNPRKFRVGQGYHLLTPQESQFFDQSLDWKEVWTAARRTFSRARKTDGKVEKSPEGIPQRSITGGAWLFRQIGPQRLTIA